MDVGRRCVRTVGITGVAFAPALGPRAYRGDVDAVGCLDNALIKRRSPPGAKGAPTVIEAVIREGDVQRRATPRNRKQWNGLNEVAVRHLQRGTTGTRRIAAGI